VHENDGAICMQLVHAGGRTDSTQAGRQPLAPSAVKVEQYPEEPRELSPADIEQIVTAFGTAAGRAKAYGFDAVQLHGAHGYLINQFLSPLTNRRNDEYGGAIENRCRFLREVYSAVREAVSESYPVMIKLNGADYVDGGLTAEDALIAAQTLDELGIDAIEVSGGTRASGDQSPARRSIVTPEQEAYLLPLARQVKAHVRCPVMSVGGIRSFAVAERAIVDHGIDYVAMSRPFIREPNLALRWQQGDRSAARCRSCNACFLPGLNEGGIYCVTEAKERAKDS
jgi:2,4-dienoyl-CoA reductase-like NADH-dependent reductase (Old Yellow Enzyme family)